MQKFESFTIKQLEARANWLSKAANVRDGEARNNLLLERKVILAEIEARNNVINSK